MKSDRQLAVLPFDLTVCKLRSLQGIDLTMKPCFVGVTDDEISLVCRTEDTPADTLEREDSWRCFRICGVLDFSLTGILSAISAVLAENQIGIFAVSTYNTDYILVKSSNLDRAVEVLSQAGYCFI